MQSKIFGCLTTLLLLLALAADLHAARYALLIGANSYDPAATGFRILGAGNDAVSLAEVLQKHKDLWSVHTLSDADGPADSRASVNRQNVCLAFGLPYTPTPEASPAPKSKIPVEGFFPSNSLKQEDLLMIYLGGHGVVANETSGDVDYFVPVDCAKDEDGNLRRNSLIPLNGIRKALLNTGAGHIIFITDICRSSATTRSHGSGKPPEVRGTADGQMTKILAEPWISRGHLVDFRSVDSNQEACEMADKGVRHGVFSYYLVRALNNPASANGNRGKQLSARELFSYAREQTKHYVYNQYGMLQEPMPGGEDYDWIAQQVILEEPVELPEVTGETVEARVGKEFNYSIDASGTPDRYRAKGLPPGLSLNAKTGEISGKIEEDEEETQSSYRVQIEARNNAGWGKGILVIKVKAKPTPSPTPKRTPRTRSTPDPDLDPEPSEQDTPSRPQPQPQPQVGNFSYKQINWTVVNGTIYAPDGSPAGRLAPPQVVGSVGTIVWGNNNVSHMRNDGMIVDLFPPNPNPFINGRWR